MIESIDFATSSKSPDHAPVDKYFQPPSQTMKTISPDSIFSETLRAPAREAPEDIPEKIPHSEARSRV